MKRAMMLAGAVLASSFGACSSNRGSGSASETPTASADKRMEVTPQLSTQDKDFIGSASGSGNYEVAAGKLALQKTQDARVRMIAERMVHDHTQANEQLALLTHQMGMIPSSAPGLKESRELDELRGLNGTDFDQAYLQQQRQAHQQAIALFEKEANNGSDNKVRQFAAQTLPTLQEHLRMINGENSSMSNERR